MKIRLQGSKQEQVGGSIKIKARGAELGRPRTLESMGLGMTHLALEDDEDPCRARFKPIKTTICY
jgi:hypothetical protein